MNLRPGFIKICGVRSVAEAEHAAAVGADAVGLNLWPKSPRALDVGRAAEIARAVRGRVAVVVVCVDAGEQELDTAVAAIRPDVIQMHGDEPAATVEAFQPRAVKAVALSKEGDLDRALGMPGPFVLLDAHDPRLRGGTGKSVDWPLAAQVCRQRRVLLAGGLNADNVAEAIAATRPWGVDVASGVEDVAADGGRHKSPEQVRRFVAASRAAFVALVGDESAAHALSPTSASSGAEAAHEGVGSGVVPEAVSGGGPGVVSGAVAGVVPKDAAR